MKEMSKEEFEHRYSIASGLSIEEMKHLGLEAVPCDCGEHGCRGWKMDGAKKIKDKIVLSYPTPPSDTGGV